MAYQGWARKNGGQVISHDYNTSSTVYQRGVQVWDIIIQEWDGWDKEIVQLLKSIL